MIVLLSFIIALSGFFSSLIALDNQYTLKPNPDAEKADALLVKLDQEIQALLESKEHNMRLSKKYLKQSGQWDSEVQSLHALKEKIPLVRNLFLEFRKNVSEMIILDNPCTPLLFSYSNWKITEWYAKYLEEILLPRDKAANKTTSIEKVESIQEIKNNEIEKSGALRQALVQKP